MRTVKEWLNMSPHMGLVEAERLHQLRLNVYFPPAIVRRLLETDKPFRMNARYWQLLQDVADGHVFRPALSGMWDTNELTRTGCMLSVARLHAADLVDLDSCPGKWYLTKLGRKKLDQR